MAHVISMLMRNCVHHGQHFTLCGLRSHSVFQPPDAFDVMWTSLRGASLEGKGTPDVHVLSVRNSVIRVARVSGARRHHADDGKGLRIQSYLVPNDLRISAKLRAPQSVAQNHFQLVPRDFSTCIKLATQLGIDSQYMKEVCGNPKTVHSHRFTGIAS